MGHWRFDIGVEEKPILQFPQISNHKSLITLLFLNAH
jgi:hypothetical protein